MSDEKRKAMISRLRRIEGQMRGLQRMIEQERNCEEIITQMAAARAALDRAAFLVLREHLGECMMQDDLAERNKSLEKALELIFRLKT